MSAEDSAVARARRALLLGVRNQLASHLVGLAARLALVPYVLSRLPRDEYGLWAWMLTLSSFLVLAELGFTAGIVHPLAQALRAGDAASVRRLLTAAMSVPAGVVGGVAALVLLLRPDLGAAPAGPGPLEVLLPLVAAQGVGLCGMPLLSLLSGLQRLDLAQALKLPQTAIQVAATIALLESGGGARSLAWLQLGLAVFSTGARWIACARMVPGLALALPARADFARLREQGTPIIVLNVLWAVTLGFERAFLGGVSSLAAFAQYAVASRLVLTVFELQGIPFASVLQATAALEAAGERAAVARLYARSLRLTALVVLGFVGMLWCAGPALVRAWVGDGFEPAGALVRRLAVGMLVAGLCGPGIGILAGRSRLGTASPLFVAWSAACAAANAAWLLATGIDGAGIALAAVNLAGTAAFLRRFERDAGVSIGPWILARVAAGAVLGTVAGGAAAAGAAGLVPAGRLGDLAVAAAAAAAFAVVHLGWAAWSGLLEARDRTIVSDFLGRLAPARPPR